MSLIPTLVLLLLPLSALLAPPLMENKSKVESFEGTPTQTPISSPKLPLDLLSSTSKPNQDVIQRAARDAGPDLDPEQQPIRILITDTCIQSDSSGGETEGDGMALNLEPGSPLVLTHRISLVPPPGGCGGGCEGLVAALRERMERLEREVSTLREKCGGTDGGCCTSQPSTGAHCTLQPEDLCPNDCSNQGRCEQGKCECFPGFSGPDCSATTCPSNCNNRGTCVNGQCLCEEGFTGPDCSGSSCPNNCNGKGQCVNGQCVCERGYTGTDCLEKPCLNNCRKRGRCVDGLCICNSGFTGPDCSERTCLNNCNDKGKCVKGKCVCNSGFAGADCSRKSCPSNCSNRGRCIDGQCTCSRGFTGPDCSEKTCLNNCNNNGKCVKGKCLCYSGFTGTDCSAKTCPSHCSNRGRCVSGQCECDHGFTGTDCSETTCPNNCNNNGKCVNGNCVCEGGFTGTDCSAKTCPNDCSNRGRCVDGQCECDSEFAGEDCSEKSCPNNCNNNGQCENGNCVCNSGFSGTDCSAKSCPNDCSNRGRCVDGQCECDSEFSGVDCSEKLCPNNCNNNGKCVNGNCVCNGGFTGTDCSAKSCPNDCSNRGRCVDGQCECDSEFTGEDCSEKSCPNNCNNNGQCENGNCVCNSGFSGTDCSDKSCPNDCSNRGRCVDGQCVCDSEFSGEDCSEKSCPNNCNSNGKCIIGQCVCDSGFTGNDCSERSCPNNCNNNGKCVNGKCMCNKGFTGTDCSDKSCPNNCRNRGRCVDGNCVCEAGFTGSDCAEKSCPGSCSDQGRCVKGKCVCNSGFTGTDCSERSCPHNCRNRGRCVNGHCVCNDSFTGADCSQKSCLNNCTNNGRCLKGKCVCNSGFMGTDCAEKSCPHNCRNRGRCVNGHCVCNDGFMGTDCSLKSCSNNCSNNGRCIKGKCACNSGFTGIDCSDKSCPNNCRNKGNCIDGQCICESGFTGPDCSDKACPSDCNDNGRCLKGKCKCNNGFTGADCSEKSCPHDCKNRGRCVDGHCMCESGFTGTDCSEKSCPHDCKNRGRCVDGHCMCESGFTGTDCSEKSCPHDCKNRGRCVDGHCICETGFTGADCSEKSCPHDCRDRGRCVDGQCECESGFTGADCSEESCPNDCNNNGQCLNGKCVCNSDFMGTDCSVKSCPNRCSDNGRCVDGDCLCNSGFSGPDCSKKSCPNDCNDQGRCVDGTCQCASGFSGEDCSEKTCLNNCRENGRCKDGRCLCFHGFTGPDCSQCEDGFAGDDCSIALIDVSPLGSRDITDSSVTVFWTPPPFQYDTYLITFTTQKEGGQPITSRIEGQLYTYTQTGLAAGQDYTVSVRGEKDGKMGAESSVEVSTLISGPRNFRVVKKTSTSVTVQWEPPVADIDRYHLFVAANQSEGGGKPSRQDIILSPEENSAHITNLEVDRLYNITLVAEKERSQSQPMTVEATPEAVPLPTARTAHLDTDLKLNILIVEIGKDGVVERKTPNPTVFDKSTEEKEDGHKAKNQKEWKDHTTTDEDGELTKVDLPPAKTGPTKQPDKGRDRAPPKVPKRPLFPKKPKPSVLTHLNGTRPVLGKAWQKRVGMNRPASGAKKKIMDTAGPKPGHPTNITNKAPPQTDIKKRPPGESNVPEDRVDHAKQNTPGGEGIQTTSNQFQVGLEIPENPKISTETSARGVGDNEEEMTVTRENIPNVNRIKVIKRYRKVGNGTVWKPRKNPGPGGRVSLVGPRESYGAGVGIVRGLDRGDSVVGHNLNMTADIAGPPSVTEDSYEPQRELLTNGRAQGKMKITKNPESSGKHRPQLPTLPSAYSPSPHDPASGSTPLDTSDNMEVEDHQSGFKPAPTPSLSFLSPIISGIEKDTNLEVHSITEEDKRDFEGTRQKANDDLGRTFNQDIVNRPEDIGEFPKTMFISIDTGKHPDENQHQHFGKQELEDNRGSIASLPTKVDKSASPGVTPDQPYKWQEVGDGGGSLDSVARMTDTSKQYYRTPDKPSGIPEPTDNSGYVRFVSKVTDTGTHSDGTQDEHSRGIEPSDKEVSLETGLVATNTATGSDGSTIERQSGNLRSGEKGHSQQSEPITTSTKADPDRTPEPHFAGQGLKDKWGSQETPSVVTDRNRELDGTQDQHFGNSRPGDKRGSHTVESITTDSGTGYGGNLDQHSGIQGLEEKKDSLESEPMKTGTSIGPDVAQNQLSVKHENEDRGISSETAFTATNKSTAHEGSHDRNSGSEKSGDKGVFLDTVFDKPKGDLMHWTPTVNGETGTTKDGGMTKAEGESSAVKEGPGEGPSRSGPPRRRIPPIRRPHTGPFRNRTRPNLVAPRHPSQGSHRRPNLPKGPGKFFPVGPQRQPSGYTPTETNRSSTQVSPSGSDLKQNGFDVKTRHNYSRTTHDISATPVGPNQKTSPTKQVGFRKLIVYTPFGTGVQNNLTGLRGSAPQIGPGFTSIEANNVTSTGFSLTWEVPHGIYRKFILTRREYRGEDLTESEKEKTMEDEEEEEDEDRRIKVGVGSSQDQDRTRDGSGLETHFPGKLQEKTQKFTKVLPGSIRTFFFQDLAPQTNYTLMLYGAGPGLRSKIHQFTVTTGPAPPSGLIFSNVTDSSLNVSWTKPKGPVSGYKVTYMHTTEGNPVTMEMDSQNSTVSLAGLSPGSNYEVSVISLQGLDESDPVKGFVKTLPDPPTDVRAINVTHNKALLLWRPALATVERYIIVYGSESGEAVRMVVSGNAAEQPLKALQKNTQYRVTITSQQGEQESTAASTAFTTTGGGKDGPRELTAKNVTPRSAVLSWKPPFEAVTGYKLTYQTAGEEAKEVTLDPSMTQYKLKRLLPRSKYRVHLQGERPDQNTAAISTEFTTGVLRYPFPLDCSQELLNGMQESGDADIFPTGRHGDAVAVYCDMETDGGGWTVFQRRVDGGTDFFRSWNEYSIGFGNISGEFWLGNELLHNLTSRVPMTMRVDLRVGAESAYAHYASFSVESQKQHYALGVSGYTGTAGDSLAYHDGQMFSTKDRDPYRSITRCSMSYRGGWWYKNCHEANLNGLYDIHTLHQGVIWTSWKGKDFSIPFSEMKIRPASFRPPPQQG